MFSMTLLNQRRVSRVMKVMPWLGDGGRCQQGDHGAHCPRQGSSTIHLLLPRQHTAAVGSEVAVSTGGKVLFLLRTVLPDG